MNELRLRFIEDTAILSRSHPLDFRVSTQVGQEGRFLDKKTHQMWLGYELFHKAAMHRVEADEKALLHGTYVIGAHIGPGPKLGMSHRPFVHKTKHSAFEEAERLTNEHGGPYAIFRCIKVTESSGVTENA
jgi:hypothetical protein